jgi:hypothetical protein
MYRPIIMFVALTATIALAQAQDADGKTGNTPCHPCLGTGTCAPVDPLQSGADHSCQRHANHNHRRLELAGSNFSEVSFGNADLRGTRFYDCLFEHASLYFADLSFGAMIGCQADSMVFADAMATNVDFSMSSLRYGYYVRTDFSDSVLIADFSCSNMSNADFTGAVFSVDSDMADFSNANLTDAVGLMDTVGIARYSPCTDFSGTGFDPVHAGWVLTIGAEIGERYCSPAVPNSTGNSAFITVVGCTDVDSNSFALIASCLPNYKFGCFLVSDGQAFIPHAGWSLGNLCLGETIGSFTSNVRHTGVIGEIGMEVNLDSLPFPLRGGVLPGQTWNYQAWFRDVIWPEINPLATTNFTDAVSVTFK